MPENRTVWKSNNQGVKAETFAQTCRMGRDRQPGGEDSQQVGGQRTRAGEVVAGRAGGPTFTCG